MPSSFAIRRAATRPPRTMPDQVAEAREGRAQPGSAHASWMNRRAAPNERLVGRDVEILVRRPEQDEPGAPDGPHAHEQDRRLRRRSDDRVGRDLSMSTIEQANGFSLYGTPVVPSLRALAATTLMIYHLSLQTAGFIAGMFLILISLPGMIDAWPCPAIWRKQLPRSRIAGIVLLTIDLAWSFWLLATMEMGEFSTFRRPLLIALPIGYVLVLRFVDEFLAVRALGILCLARRRAAARSGVFPLRNEPAARDSLRLSADRRRTVLGDDALSAARSN